MQGHKSTENSSFFSKLEDWKIQDDVLTFVKSTKVKQRQVDLGSGVSHQNYLTRDPTPIKNSPLYVLSLWDK